MNRGGGPMLDKELYDNARAKIQESVKDQLDEAEAEGEYTHEEREAMFEKWLNRYDPDVD